jgi:hypothetical protein
MFNGKCVRVNLLNSKKKLLLNYSKQKLNVMTNIMFIYESSEAIMWLDTELIQEFAM